MLHVVGDESMPGDQSKADTPHQGG